MYWAFAIAVFLVAAVVFAIVRPFTNRVSFKTIFEVVGTAWLFAPIVALSPVILISFLLLYPLLGLFAVLFLVGGTSALLRSVGLLGVVQSLGVWGLLPEWGWYLAGALVMGALIFWQLNRPLRLPARKGGPENES